MSPIIFVAPLLGFTASLAVWVVHRCWSRLRRQPHKSSRFVIVLAVMAFPLVCSGIFVWLPWVTIKSGVDVSADVANKHLVTFKVPSDATHVDFRNAVFSGLVDVADFAIDEKRFLAWASSNGWKVHRFSYDGAGLQWQESVENLPKYASGNAGRVVPVQSILNRTYDWTEIRNGYYFDDYRERRSHDCGLTVMYDLDHSRAYVQQTMF
jgi:hypothetical protein